MIDQEKLNKLILKECLYDLEDMIQDREAYVKEDWDDEIDFSKSKAAQSLGHARALLQRRLVNTDEAKSLSSKRLIERPDLVFTGKFCDFLVESANWGWIERETKEFWLKWLQAYKKQFLQN